MTTNNALLTGATGFLGSYILRALQASGYETTTVSRQLSWVNDHITHDLADPDAKLTLPGTCDLVIHAAGKAHVVPQNPVEQQAFWDLNYHGTKKLLSTLERQASLPQALVLISTVSIYGLEAGTNISEEAPLNATDAYGASKREAEKLVEEWAKRNNTHYLILRLPLVAGKAPPGNLGAIVQAIQKGRYLGIGKGQARKSMVMADDVADLVARAPGQPSGTYHLTDGYHPAFRELENAIQEVSGKKVPLRLPQPAACGLAMAGDLGQTITRKKLPFNSGVYRKMTRDLTFSDAKARAHLNWQPSSVLERMEEVVNSLCS
jgi:nucleoside-diphosphate-sugar epimerase